MQTAEGKLHLNVAIDRMSNFAFTQLVEKANRRTASEFVEALIAAVPYKIHTVLTERAIEGAIGSSPMAIDRTLGDQRRNGRSRIRSIHPRGFAP